MAKHSKKSCNKCRVKKTTSLDDIKETYYTVIERAHHA